MKETETLRELLNRGILTKPEYEHIKKQRLYRKKRRRYIVIVAILSCIFVVSVVLYYGISVETYNHRNTIQNNTQENDIMEIDGQPVEFYLGSFKDLNFSKSAILYFNNLYDGQIKYYITPTKDRSSYSVVRINPIPNPMLRTSEDERYFSGDKSIGPYIYRKGWNRIEVGQ